MIINDRKTFFNLSPGEQSVHSMNMRDVRNLINLIKASSGKGSNKKFKIAAKKCSRQKKVAAKKVVFAAKNSSVSMFCQANCLPLSFTPRHEHEQATLKREVSLCR